jgi:hypothetical protein
MNLKPLLIALFAITIGYEKGLPDDASKTLKSKDVRDWIDYVDGLRDAIDATLGGGTVDYAALASGVKAYLDSYRVEPTSSMALSAILQAFVTWFRNGSPQALAKIEKASASTIFPTWVTKGFLKEDDRDQSDSSSKLRKLVKKMAGYDEDAFHSTEDAKAAKEAYPDLYAQYLLLRREYNDVWKSAISDIVRASGMQTLPMQTVERALDKKGIVHGMPAGFTGKIDAICRWYDNEDNLLTGVPSAAMFPTVRMNDSSDAEWVAQAIRADGTGAGYLFRQADQIRNKMAKFERVRDFFPIVDKMRRKWVSLIKNFDPSSPETVAAVVLELVFTFSARVGTGRGSTGGETTFGMSTLLKKHFSESTRGFILKYKGKDAVSTKHVFNIESGIDKTIVEIVYGLAADKKPDDPLFTYTLKNGDQRPITAQTINRLFKALGAPEGVTVRNLRTYHGSRIFKEETEKLYAKKAAMANGKEAMEYLDDIARKVGKALNHVRRTADGAENVTPATALANYIDVTLQVDFFQHYGLPLPARLEKMTQVEAAVELGVGDPNDVQINLRFLEDLLGRGGVPHGSAIDESPYSNLR